MVTNGDAMPCDMMIILVRNIVIYRIKLKNNKNDRYTNNENDNNKNKSHRCKTG